MKKSIQGIKSCHLEQASRTARIWQFGRTVLGGNFWFPGWIFFILVFSHSYKAYRNFSPEFAFVLFLPYVSFKPTVCYVN